MSKEYFMRQCMLRKGNTIQASWIPEKFAKIGKYLKLHDEDGWQVVSISDERKSSTDAIERSQDYKNTRKASDI